jgi:saccharopine dehydrogenase (NADP+, L-glutamate forming)
MNRILVIGAGRSATSLIKYLLEACAKHRWTLTVAEADIELAQKKVGGHTAGKVVKLDAAQPGDRRRLVSDADVVISMLPPGLHHEVALDCIALGKHLFTASYVSPQMYALDEEVQRAGLIFVGELGLDPGIDHMSAIEKIHEIKALGGHLTAFRSYTGGLVAPESDDNPWHYKISWNPRNVVLAGQGTARYLEQGSLKFLPYHRLFDSYRLIDVPGYGKFETYPNRDSLQYRSIYELDDIPTLIRGTIRHRGFCDAWHALVMLGLTDATYQIPASANWTYRQWLASYLPAAASALSLEDRVARVIVRKRVVQVMHQLRWLGLFDDTPIGIPNASPAQILEGLLLRKWSLRPTDKDMVVMQHQFEYELGAQRHLLTSTLVMRGHDADATAMSALVGLPLGIFVRHVMLGHFRKTGVRIPVTPDMYRPVLAELHDFGMEFFEKTKLLP